MRAWVDRQLGNLEVGSVPVDVTRRDVLVAVVLGVGALVEVAFEWTGGGLVGAGISAPILVSLPWRRARPGLVMAIVVVGQLATDVGSVVADDSLQPPVAIDVASLLVLYAFLRWLPFLRAVAIGASLVVVAIAADVLDGNLDRSVALVIVWSAVASYAMAMRYRACLIEQGLRQARLAERQELAREVHDIVAHHVSAIAVQAQAARAVLDVDPPTASALDAISSTASQALNELRRVVGILRGDETRSPTLTAPQLRNLANDSCEPKVFVRDDVGIDNLPTTVGTALFRIAQEAVTNARRHARHASYVDITVTRALNTVTLEVVNDGQRSTRKDVGFGLTGMRERVEALGGLFEAGPRDAAGWQITAKIPLESAAP